MPLMGDTRSDSEHGPRKMNRHEARGPGTQHAATRHRRENRTQITKVRGGKNKASSATDSRRWAGRKNCAGLHSGVRQSLGKDRKNSLRPDMR